MSRQVYIFLFFIWSCHQADQKYNKPIFLRETSWQERWFESLNLKLDLVEGWNEVLLKDSILAFGNSIKGQKLDFWTICDHEKQLKANVIYQNDTLHGLFQIFYKEQLIVQGPFNKGVRDGYWRFFNQQGFLQKKGHYYKDLRSGWWQEYDSLGIICLEGAFVNGQPEGYQKIYEQGVIRSEGKKVGENKIGQWKYYNEQGICIKIEQNNE